MKFLIRYAILLFNRRSFPCCFLINLAVKITPCTPYTEGCSILLYIYSYYNNTYQALLSSFTCIDNVDTIVYKTIIAKFSCDSSTLSLIYLINRREDSNTRNKSI